MIWEIRGRNYMDWKCMFLNKWTVSFWWMSILPAQMQSLEDNLILTCYFSSPEMGSGCFSKDSFDDSVPKQRDTTPAAQILILFSVQWFQAVNTFTSVVQVLLMEIGHRTLIERLALAPSSDYFKKIDTAPGDFSFLKHHWEYKQMRRKNSRTENGEWPWLSGWREEQEGTEAEN